MSMKEWAEQECRIACKRENPNFDFDSDEFDYGCSCYKSALKAYKSLCEDDHSGASFSFTRNILKRLMDGLPLTAITEDDFDVKYYKPDEDEWLNRQGLISDIQCKRMYSLFRLEYKDGRVVYHDNDRYYMVNLENPSDTFHSGAQWFDQMFPITLPYTPLAGKYEIYTQTFLVDKRHGDFDTRGTLYVITPEGKRIDIGIYETEGDDGKWHRITREEYSQLLARRIDTLDKKAADHLLWTLISNCDDYERREKAYKNVPQTIKDNQSARLIEMCKFFCNEDNYKYNTFSIHYALCNMDTSKYSNIQELVEIANYLKEILDTTMQYE